MIIFEKNLLDRMKEDAKQRYPNECCGILIGRRTETGKRLVDEVYPVENEAGGKQKWKFQIDSLAVLKVERYAAEDGRDIVGFYHSHSDCQATASAEDEHFALPDCSYPVLSVYKGEIYDIQSWVLEKSEKNKFRFQKEMIQCREEGEKTLCL